MQRIPTARVDMAVLQALFDDCDLWAMIDDHSLSTEIVPGTRVPSHRWPTGTSMILRHRTRDGKHLATTHCINDWDGTVLHRDPKDLRVDEIRIWRP